MKRFKRTMLGISFSLLLVITSVAYAAPSENNFEKNSQFADLSLQTPFVIVDTRSGAFITEEQAEEMHLQGQAALRAQMRMRYGSKVVFEKPINTPLWSVVLDALN